MEKKYYFNNKENIKLCGILTEPKNITEKCIILCHGITVDKDEGGLFIELAKKLSKENFTVFRFDFRGHGESQGNSINLTIKGEKEDLTASVKFLKRLGYKRFIILAASFGGGAASLFTADNPSLIEGLILWNAIIDYTSLLEPVLPWPKKYFGKEAMTKLEKNGFIEIGSDCFKIGKILIEEIKKLEPWKKLKELNIPILFIHGDSDTYVPYEDSVKYAKMFINASLKTIKNGEHGLNNNDKEKKESIKSAVDFILNNF